MSTAFVSDGQVALSRRAGREGWVDALRAFALLMLVASHCCDPFNSPLLEHTPQRALWGSLYLSALRPCVPLFVMITGYLLLPGREESYGSFYRRRIFRVLWPFLIWSVLYNVFPWIVFHFSATAEAARATVVSFFSFADPAPTEEGVFRAMWGDLVRIPLDFSGYNTHMWYVFVLIGLYFLVPFLAPWAAKASHRQILCFLGLCAAASLIPFARFYGGFYADPAFVQSGHILGFCEWNDAGMLHYFSGFVGYLVAGMYLGRLPELSWRKTLAIALPLLVAGYLVTFFLFQAVKASPGCTDSMLEQPIAVTSINVAMMTAGLFLMGRKLHARGAAAKICASLGVCCFGIYMCHYFCVGAAYTACSAAGLPTPVIIPASALLALLVAWGFVAALKRLPGGLRWFLG